MIAFENTTKLDPLAFQLMGVHAKDSDNPIGKFGTGLKYSIAILLRENIDFEIWSYGKQYKFHTVTKDFRGQAINQVYCNDMPLGYSTHIGSHWTLENVYRELYCNAHDEKGIIRVVPDRSMTDIHNSTVILVDGLEEEHAARHKLFLHDKTPLHENEFGKIYPVVTNNQALFYRDIKVNHSEMPCKFSYSITQGVELTEDRTVTNIYEYLRCLAQTWACCDDPKLLEKLFAAKDSYETVLPFTQLVTYATSRNGYHVPEFFMGELRKWYENGNTLNNNDLYQLLKEQDKEVGPQILKLTVSDQKEIDSACDFLKAHGYPVAAYPIYKIRNKDTSRWAIAENGKIFLTQHVIDLGGDDLKATLLEEFFHLRHDYADLTRNFQNFLHEELIRNMKNK